LTHTLTCKHCVLGTSDDKSIVINKDGICNYCLNFKEHWIKRESETKRNQLLSNLVMQIKDQKKKYDCLLGISGGVDSSYLAYWAHQEGLSPLVVHFDNGWNSELAVENIQKICTKLNFDLKTIVIDWQIFKKMQIAYLKAGVVDIEVLTDHAIYATITQLAKKNKIKYVISGYNLATEGIMPKGWVYDKRDWSNIKSIVKKHSDINTFGSFPHVSFWQGLRNHFFHQQKIVQPLNLMNYNKNEAKEILKKELGWRDYGGKHYESIFTKFYQAYILPHKFGIDKRKAHLATIINSDQINKKTALSELEKPLYPNADFEQDRDYVLKKLNLSLDEFENIMQSPVQSHLHFDTDKALWNRYFKIINLIKLKK